jgi:hypothetical protein
MKNQIFENFDLVSIQGEHGVWTIVETRNTEPKHKVQLGGDGASVKYVDSATLTLVQKAKKPDTGPGFYPGRSIMG